MCTLPLLSSLSPSVWQPTVYKADWSFIMDHVIFVLSPHQLTPLHWAADKGHVSTVKCLFENGANPHIIDGLGVSICSIVISELESLFTITIPPTFHIMAYGSTPYVGMAPKKNGGHIKSAQMTHSKCLH